MRKKYLSIILAMTMTATLLSACGSKNADDVNGENATEAVGTTESTDASSTEQQESEEEKTPEMVEVEYSFLESRGTQANDNMFIFSEGLAWVGYSDKDNNEMYGVIDTDGNLVFSINPNEYFEGGNYSSVGVTPFIGGRAAIYCANKGLAIVDTKGEAVVSELGDGKYFTGYTPEGEFFYSIHSTGFSEDTWTVNKVKTDGSVEALSLTMEDDRDYENALKISDVGAHSAIMCKLADGVYIKNRAILNENLGKIVYNSYTFYGMMENTMSGMVRIDQSYIAIGELATVESDDDMRNIVSDNNYNKISEYTYVFRDLENGYYVTSAVTGSQYDDYDLAIVDGRGNKLFDIPSELKDKRGDETSDGKYYATIAKGADDSYYVALVDNTGKMAYEPVKLDGYPGNIAMVDGYSFVYLDGEYIIVSPSGERVTDGDISGISADAVLTDRNDWTKPRIAEGFVYYPNGSKLVSFDGKKEFTGVKTMVPYEETKSNKNSSDDNDGYDEVAEKAEELKDFMGTYATVNGSDKLTIADGSCTVNIEGQDFECIDYYRNISVGSEELYIPFDDGSEVLLAKVKDDKYTLTFENVYNSAVTSGKAYQFYLD